MVSIIDKDNDDYGDMMWREQQTNRVRQSNSERAHDDDDDDDDDDDRNNEDADEDDDDDDRERMTHWQEQTQQPLCIFKYNNICLQIYHESTTSVVIIVSMNILMILNNINTTALI